MKKQLSCQYCEHAQVTTGFNRLYFIQNLQAFSHTALVTGNMTALVVGNPRLPSTVTEQWGWSDIPHAEQEAGMVAEMLQAKALVGSQVSAFGFLISKLLIQ